MNKRELIKTLSANGYEVDWQDGTFEAVLFLMQNFATEQNKVRVDKELDVIEKPDENDEKWMVTIYKNGDREDPFMDALTAWREGEELTYEELILKRDTMRQVIQNELIEKLYRRETEIKKLEDILTTIRPKHDAYDRICQQLGIDKDILGHVNKLTETIAKQKIERVEELEIIKSEIDTSSYGEGVEHNLNLLSLKIDKFLSKQQT